jgi:hypothetical protein
MYRKMGKFINKAHIDIIMAFRPLLGVGHFSAGRKAATHTHNNTNTE